MANFIQAGKQDFIPAVDESAAPESDLRCAVIFIYNLDDRPTTIAEARYGATLDEAASQVVAAQEAQNEESRAWGADLSSGAKSTADLREHRRRQNELYAPNFVGLTDSEVQLRAELGGVEGFVVLAENELLGPHSSARFCAVLLNPTTGPSFGTPMPFRAGATMGEALRKLEQALP